MTRACAARLRREQQRSGQGKKLGADPSLLRDMEISEADKELYRRAKRSRPSGEPLKLEDLDEDKVFRELSQLEEEAKSRKRQRLVMTLPTRHQQSQAHADMTATGKSTDVDPQGEPISGDSGGRHYRTRRRTVEANTPNSEVDQGSRLSVTPDPDISHNT